MAHQSTVKESQMFHLVAIKGHVPFLDVSIIVSPANTSIVFIP